MKFNNKVYFLYLLSGLSITLAILHLLFPNLGIDYVFLSFVLLAALPWVLPLLKSVEFPGGFKIELKEMKAALDKASKIIEVDNLYQKQTITSTELKDMLFFLREIAASNPSLAFVGYRIEIEKRIRKLADKYYIIHDKKTLGYIVRELRDKSILPPDLLSSLSDLITLGNKAAHGADVAPEAANWLLDSGQNILSKLDDFIENK